MSFAEDILEQLYLEIGFQNNIKDENYKPFVAGLEWAVLKINELFELRETGTPLRSCTCDEHADDPCPRHKYENRLQDMRILIRELREILVKCADHISQACPDSSYWTDELGFEVDGILADTKEYDGLSGSAVAIFEDDVTMYEKTAGWDGSGWYFWDDDRERLHGPFGTKEEAHKAHRTYAAPEPLGAVIRRPIDMTGCDPKIQFEPGKEPDWSQVDEYDEAKSGPNDCYCGDGRFEVSATMIACKNCGRVWGRCNGVWRYDPTSAPGFDPNPMIGNDQHFFGAFVKHLYEGLYGHDKAIALAVVNAYAAAVNDRGKTPAECKHIVDTFSDEFGCTVRSCSCCGCLVAGGPTTCGNCAAKQEQK